MQQFADDEQEDDEYFPLTDHHARCRHADAHHNAFMAQIDRPTHAPGLNPQLLHKLTWQILRVVHAKATAGSIGHAKIWLDAFGTRMFTVDGLPQFSIEEMQAEAERLARKQPEDG